MICLIWMLFRVTVFPDLESPKYAANSSSSDEFIFDFEEVYTQEVLNSFMQFLALHVHHLAINELIINLSAEVIQQYQSKELIN